MSDELSMEEAYRDMQEAFLSATDRIRALEAKLKQREAELEQAKAEYARDYRGVSEEGVAKVLYADLALMKDRSWRKLATQLGICGSASTFTRLKQGHLPDGLTTTKMLIYTAERRRPSEAVCLAVLKPEG